MDKTLAGIGVNTYLAQLKLSIDCLHPLTFQPESQEQKQVMPRKPLSGYVYSHVV